MVITLSSPSTSSSCQRCLSNRYNNNCDMILFVMYTHNGQQYYYYLSPRWLSIISINLYYYNGQCRQDVYHEQCGRADQRQGGRVQQY